MGTLVRKASVLSRYASVNSRPIKFSHGDNHSKVLLHYHTRPRRQSQRRISCVPHGNQPNYRGLINLGNSCYQNAIIQSLNAVPNFARLMRADVDWTDGSIVGPSLQQVIGELWGRKKASGVSPRRVLMSMMEYSQGELGRQEDAHEFLMSLVQALRIEGARSSESTAYKELDDDLSILQRSREEWELSCKLNDSFVDDLFGFQFYNSLSCPECGYKSSRFEYAIDLQVEIPAQTAETSLTTCIQATFQPEKICGYQCGGCGSFVDAVKRTSISKFPQNLVVLVKRFNAHWNGSCMVCEKVSTKLSVDCDILDVSDLTTSDLEFENSSIAYSLDAAVCHYGAVGFGHYTAVVKGGDGVFRIMNDERVAETLDVDGYCEDAYILMYSALN